MPIATVTRRQFLHFCAAVASLYSLPAANHYSLAAALQRQPRQPVIWLSLQSCTGCSESLTRAAAPTLESLLFEVISLEYFPLLQAPSSEPAAASPQYKPLLVIEGSLPDVSSAALACSGGHSALSLVAQWLQQSSAVICVGSCACYGGLPAAAPNPTAAASIAALMDAGTLTRKPLLALPGCPPLPFAISGAIAHFAAYHAFPARDAQHRPLSVYGNTVHKRCTRYTAFTEGKFVERFDDEGARQGWCLYKLGCRGPQTHNDCAVAKWNDGISSPIDAGHPCLGCSEDGFWDRGPFYRSLDQQVFRADDAAVNPQADAGDAIYHEQCVFCHSTDPTRFRTPAADIADTLNSGTIRAHRRLSLTDQERQALQDYLLRENPP